MGVMIGGHDVRVPFDRPLAVRMGMRGQTSAQRSEEHE